MNLLIVQIDCLSPCIKAWVMCFLKDKQLLSNSDFRFVERTAEQQPVASAPQVVI